CVYQTGLSGNVLKNAMGVGIPGTGMIGLPIAIALGAIVGRSEYGLEVLRDVNDDAVALGREMIDRGIINISLAEDAPSILHIEATVYGDGDERADAIISATHTGFVRVAHGDEILFEADSCEGTASAGEGTVGTAAADCKLDMASVVEYATTAPLSEIEFILEARRLNRAAAEYALDGDFGHSLGSSIRTGLGLRLFGDSPLEHIISMTSAACDARMGGAPVAVMSNSGSGNQGICATMPVVAFAEDNGATEEETARALMMSHLTSIYIKQSLGRLSALCGCVVASTGASAGLTWLLGGDYKEICAAVKNMIANLTGMICDGAKPSCSLKISSGVSTALMSAMLAMNGKCVSQSEGIISDDVDRSIRNLTMIGRDAMRETDRLVLEIMTSK
ncbi:MAG: L-serine ammonia-lyase, iron-sulfur-dependent, subunit alpha, partial [Muribaculaceae bacterium]|nr:L-serine ammonia-lyase, iron-sulfur-dependent, subunit alpha [Muribaculaceae bacterium]